MVSALACTVMLITSYGGMILPVKATEQTAYCGHEEHQHSQECYEKRLICGHEETTGEPMMKAVSRSPRDRSAARKQAKAVIPTGSPAMRPGMY